MLCSIIPLTQTQLAAAVGDSNNHISSAETGKVLPGLTLTIFSRKVLYPPKNIAQDVSPERFFFILYSIVFQSLRILFSLSKETPTLISFRLSAA